MKTLQSSVSAPALWLVRLVGLLGMAWNGFACLDFAMTMVRFPSYLANVPADVIQFIDAAPPWAIAGWGLGVGAGLAGSFLLAMRHVLAPFAFAASLAGLAVLTAWQLCTGLPPGMNGAGSLALIAFIWIVAVGLLAFAVRAWRRGALR